MQFYRADPQNVKKINSAPDLASPATALYFWYRWYFPPPVVAFFSANEASDGRPFLLIMSQLMHFSNAISRKS
jgi:hypothetical protein